MFAFHFPLENENEIPVENWKYSMLGQRSDLWSGRMWSWRVRNAMKPMKIDFVYVIAEVRWDRETHFESKWCPSERILSHKNQLSVSHFEIDVGSDWPSLFFKRKIFRNLGASLSLSLSVCLCERFFCFLHLDWTD